MTIRQSMKELTTRWKIVGGFIALGLLSAVIYAVFVPVKYTSTIELYVSAQTSDTTNAAYQGGLLSQQRVKSYTEIVTNPRVTQQVISSLRLPDTQQQLAAKLSAESSPDSVLLSISATDSDPARAQLIANATAQVFIDVVNDLERPERPNTTQPVSVRAVAPADLPAGPSSTSPALLILIGILAGAFVGSSTALALSALNTKILSPDNLRNLSDRPILGDIPASKNAAENVIATLQAGTGSWVESFKELRTNIQFVGGNRAEKILAVSSSLPGEGKSTVSVALATVLAQSGMRVLLIDGDLRRPRVADIFGVESSVGLSTVLAGRVKLASATQDAPGVANLSLLASGLIPPNPSELLASQAMVEALNDAKQQWDIVIIDTPPLLPVTDAAALSPHVSGIVLVCQTSRIKIQELRASQDKVLQGSGKVLGLISTMSSSRGRARRGGSYYEYGYLSRPANNGVQKSGQSLEASASGSPSSGDLESATTRPVPHRRTT